MHPLWQQAVDEGRCDLAHAERYHEKYTAEDNTCDTCGKLVVPLVEAGYGAADPGPRHYECTSFRKAGHATALEASRVAVGDLGKKMKEFEDLLGGLRGKVNQHSKADADFDEIMRRRGEGPRSGPVKRGGY